MVKIAFNLFKSGQRGGGKRPSDLEKKLGVDTLEYLKILDTYGVSWPIEKAARDTWQNFFDGNNQTLDGINLSAIQEGNEYIIRIQNHAQYDIRRLLHLGATTKADDPSTAGGFGEGAKVLALVLLRDYGFSQIRFGSEDWELDFLLHELPEGEYPEPRKGLFAGLRHTNRKLDGNFIEFKTASLEYAIAFLSAKNLFYHSRNPDFESPTLDIPDIGGFKFLPREEGSKDAPKGNFYYIGQRRHFDKEEWNTVEHVHLWTYKDLGLKRDRDRGIVTRNDISNMILPKILDAAKTDDLTRIVYKMMPIWSESMFFEIGYSILEGISRRLAKQGVSLEFEDKHLADDLPLSSQSIKDSLRKEGYVLCHGFLANIGMKSAIKRFIDMQRHYKLENTPDEEERVNILYEAIKPLGKERRDILVYDRETEKSIVQGQYNQEFVWISRDALRKPFNEALATYLHEMDHKHGTDQSAEFSYGLTATMGTVIQGITKQPTLYQRLEKAWNQSLEKSNGTSSMAK